jgi:uncharacterized membrane protein YeaQ/YmgE (transglycosylase-associated protein family)
MALLIAIILGIAVGGLASYIWQENLDSLAINIVFGLAGAVFGTGIYYFVLDNATSAGLFNLIGLLTSLLGAIIFVLIFNLLHWLFNRHIRLHGAPPDPTDEPK